MDEMRKVSRIRIKREGERAINFNFAHSFVLKQNLLPPKCDYKATEHEDFASKL
jgi:hypothetical protein